MQMTQHVGDCTIYSMLESGSLEEGKSTNG